MLVQFDVDKDAANIRKHRVSLAALVALVDALTGPAKMVGGEERQFVIGRLDDVVFYGVFVVRGKVLRPISLRPAHRKERKYYEAELSRRA